LNYNFFAGQDGLQEGCKKMMPDMYVTAHTQFSSYTNNDGVFGDPDLMSVTENGHNNQIPTY
jgi:hypothetical protein